MTYFFRYRRHLIWKSYQVAGHGYAAEQDKMVLYFPDGSIQEICKWRECEAKLNADWVLAQKKNMEQKAGQSIQLGVEDA